MSLSSSTLLSIRNVLLSSVFLRVALIIYSEWHDAHSVIKYTDVDYRVFTDASSFLLKPGPGDLNCANGPLKNLFGYAISLGK